YPDCKEAEREIDDTIEADDDRCHSRAHRGHEIEDQHGRPEVSPGQDEEAKRKNRCAGRHEERRCQDQRVTKSARCVGHRRAPWVTSRMCKKGARLMIDWHLRRRLGHLDFQSRRWRTAPGFCRCGLVTGRMEPHTAY